MTVGGAGYMKKLGPETLAAIIEGRIALPVPERAESA